MKKIIINILLVLIIFVLLCSVIFSFNKKDKSNDDNKELKTVKVADATLT